MSAPVRIEAEAWTDLRFATLARILGLGDADHALLKVALLWSRMAELQTAHHAELVLFGTVEGDREESLHAHLDALGKRVRGEWFRFDEETIELLAAHGITRRG